MKPKILVIVGPTASGKTALSIKLARALAVSGIESEIVSADSRQVYRGLNIGSGKVTKREMAGIPHHMIDIVSPSLTFTVVDYRAKAEKAIDNILSRGKLPIIVGGTGQYIDSITKGLTVPNVPPNQTLRHKLDKLTSTKLFKLLKQTDSNRAKHIDKDNKRRLVRAIEIATALGKVPALVSKPRYSPVILGLKIEDGKLKINIRKRLLARMRAGMVSEVKKVHKGGLSWKRLYDLGLEYRYISLYLQNKFSKKEMLEKLETEIWHYAKRQMTWFKRDKSIHWLAKSEATRTNLPRLLARHSKSGGGASLPRLRRSANLFVSRS